MKVSHFFRTVLLGIFLTLTAPPASVAEGTGPGAGSDTSDVLAADESREATDSLREKRSTVIAEAAAAVRETKAGLKALEENRVSDALDALALATGKLEIVLARDPDLALAPVDVDTTVFDLLSAAETVENVIEKAAEYFDDGEIQRARRLIENLRSEIVISVTSLPLATYPDAIKAVTPLIDKGELDEARVALETALSTLVIEDYAFPLPALRAEVMLEKAEELAEKERRSEKESEELAFYLDGARDQILLAQALGYGGEEIFDDFYSQLETVREKTKDGKSGKGFFGKITDAIKSIKNNFVEVPSLGVDLKG